MLGEENLFNNQLLGEYSDYNSLHDKSHLKTFGQYFTPLEIAEALALWLSPTSDSTIIDPGSGLGVFEWALNHNFRDRYKRIIGFEIDKELLKRSQSLLSRLRAEKNVILVNKDFLTTNLPVFDRAISNPPYVIYKVSRLPEDLRAKFSRVVGGKISSMANLYNFFLIKVLDEISEGGRGAFIIPKEFLNTDYGVVIKNYIKGLGIDFRLVFFESNLNLFESAITTSCLVLFEKTKSDSLKYFRVKDQDDWSEIYSALVASKETNFEKFDNLFSSVNYSTIKPKTKWNLLGTKSKNTKSYDSKIGDFIRCSRGLATGANDFYIFNRSKMNQWNLDEKYFKRCITKSTHVKGLILNEKVVDKLEAEDKSIYVLDLKEQDILNPAVAKYIDFGTKQGVDQKYLPARRNPWYSSEKIKVAPALIGTFFRSEVKVIANKTKLSNLTCFHGLYLNDPSLPSNLIDAISAYLMSKSTGELVKQNIRKLGDGLNKFEPKDVQAIPCPNFIKDEKLRNNLAKLYNELVEGNTSLTNFHVKLENFLI